MFQSEAMLLLLILAVLGTPTFSAEEYHGRSTGTHFCTSTPEGKNLTGVRVYVQNSVIKGIQMKHGDSWGEVYGYSQGSPVTSLLDTDENIISASGTFSHLINQVIFITSRPRMTMAGNRRGPNDYSDSPDKSDQVLQGICGYYVRAGMTALSFVWRNRSGTCPK